MDSYGIMIKEMNNITYQTRHLYIGIRKCVRDESTTILTLHNEKCEAQTKPMPKALRF